MEIPDYNILITNAYTSFAGGDAMTILQVLYVLEVARQNSISKAAENLFVSQPALSAQIKRLE